jgi:ADP-ribose pyrophosphatase
LTRGTGFSGPDPVLLGQCRPNPAILNNTCHFVLIENAHPLETLSWDHHEELEIRLVPLADVWQWFRGGRLSHVMTQAALLHYAMRSNGGGGPGLAC